MIVPRPYPWLMAIGSCLRPSGSVLVLVCICICVCIWSRATLRRSVEDIELAARLVFGVQGREHDPAPLPYRDVRLPERLRFGYYLSGTSILSFSPFSSPFAFQFVFACFSFVFVCFCRWHCRPFYQPSRHVASVPLILIYHPRPSTQILWQLNTTRPHLSPIIGADSLPCRRLREGLSSQSAGRRRSGGSTP